MSKIKEVEIRVKEILRECPETRNNDNLLYTTYVEEYHYVEFNKKTFVNYEEYGLPSYKTIERCRRKIQNEQNVYKATEKTERDRAEAAEEYKELFTK